MTIEQVKAEFEAANPGQRYEIKNGALYMVHNDIGYGVASMAIDGRIYSTVRDGQTILPLERF